MKVEIDSNDVNEEYLKAIEKAINIRKNKRLIYKDTFLSDSIEFLKLQLENKLKRLNLCIVNNNIINNIENAEDSLIDMINYAAFLIAVINKEKK